MSTTAERVMVDAERLEAPIRRVEVFVRSALVERRCTVGEASGTAGAEERVFELAGLPLGLVDGSLRVELAAADRAGCAVLEAQVGLDVATPVEEASLAEEQRLKALHRQRAALVDDQHRLARRADELGALRPILPPPPKRPDQPRFSSDPPLEGWLALTELGQAEAEQAWAAHRELGTQLRALDDQIRAAEDALVAVSSQRVAALDVRKKIYLRLAGPVAGLELRISYQVQGARWFPSYELRVDADGSEAELVVSALVTQVTDEDWQGVDLALSTADLRRRCDLPRLGAWRIGRPVRDARQAWRPLPDDLPALFADFDRERPPAPVAAPAREGGLTREVERVSGTGAHPAVLEAPEPLAGAAYGMEDDELEGELAEEEMAFDYMEADIPVRAASASMPPPAPMAAQAMAPAPGGGFAGSPHKAKKRDRAAANAGPHLARAEEQPAEEQPAEGLLDYGRLVLGAGGDGTDRGLLRPMRREEQVADSAELAGAVAEALQAADEARVQRLFELEALALPRGARDVGASAGHFAYRYETRASAEIPADGGLHRIAVARQRLPIELFYRTVPRLEEGAVYRLARASNPLDNPLLAGSLDVFWGNDFIVTARLETTAGGAAIEANLGVEPRIKVARNVDHSEREEGLLGGRRVCEEQLTIELKNGLASEAQLEVIERLPVTEERKLEISVVAESPPAEDYQQKETQRPIRGGRRWRLRLAPAAEQRCVLRYTMTMPSSNEIVGGGRRA